LTGWVGVAIFHAVVNLQVTVTLTLSTVCKVLLRLLHKLYSPFAITSVSTSYDATMNMKSSLRTPTFGLTKKLNV
jgi:hypothetical protein